MLSVYSGAQPSPSFRIHQSLFHRLQVERFDRGQHLLDGFAGEAFRVHVFLLT
jgi:hypothetical protein